MIVYFSVLLFIILVCWLSKEKGDGAFTLGACIFAIYLMISFQAGWGGDWEAYNTSFLYYNGMSLSDILAEDRRQMQFGYKFLYSILPSYRVVIFIFSAWYCVALFILFKQLIPRKWWPLAFLFLFINRPLLMGALAAISRTGFAASAFIIGLYFLSKGQRLRFVIIILIASLFHTSILFLLPFMFLPTSQGRIDPAAGVALFSVIFLFFLLSPSSWTGFVEQLIMSTDTFSEYEVYLEEDSKERMISVLTVFSFFWVYELFVHSRESGLSKNEYLLMYMALIQIAFSFLPSVGLSGRFYYYINYGFFAGMMVLLEKEKKEAFRLIIILSLIVVFGKQFLTFSRTPYFAEHWLHYHAFWNY